MTWILFYRMARAALFGIILLVVGACAPQPSYLADTSSPLHVKDLQALESRVHRLVNGHRVCIGLKPLEYSEQIARVARAHSRDMAERRAPFGHHGFDSRMQRIGQAVLVGAMAENVGYNDYPRSETAQVALKKWLQSPGHRDCIEDAFDLTGVGVVLDSQGVYYYTQIFVRMGPR